MFGFGLFMSLLVGFLVVADMEDGKLLGVVTVLTRGDGGPVKIYPFGGAPTQHILHGVLLTPNTGDCLSLQRLFGYYGGLTSPFDSQHDMDVRAAFRDAYVNSGCGLLNSVLGSDCGVDGLHNPNGDCASQESYYGGRMGRIVCGPGGEQFISELRKFTAEDYRLEGGGQKLSPGTLMYLETARDLAVAAQRDRCGEPPPDMPPDLPAYAGPYIGDQGP